MAALRNTQLWKGTVSSGSFTTVYTVPAGKLVVVKDINAQHTDSGSAQIIVGVGGLYLWSVPLTAYGGAGARVEITPWWALAAGNVLQVACSTGHHVDMLIGGSIYFV